MKNSFKKLLAIFAVLAIMITAIPVSAVTQDASWKYFQNLSSPMSDITMRVQPSSSLYLTLSEYSLGTVPASTSKITVTSSKTNVAAVRKVKVNNKTTKIVVLPKKAGTTTIKLKVAGYTYTKKVAVEKYVNPIRSIKIGNTTISGSKFNKKDAYNFKFSKFSGKKTAFSLKLKSGWYLNGVTEKISNSNNLNYLDPDIKTFKVRSKKGSYSLILNFYNEKQHSNENVVLNFK